MPSLGICIKHVMYAEILTYEFEISHQYCGDSIRKSPRNLSLNCIIVVVVEWSQQKSEVVIRTGDRWIPSPYGLCPLLYLSGLYIFLVSLQMIINNHLDKFNLHRSINMNTIFLNCRVCGRRAKQYWPFDERRTHLPYLFI